MIEKNKYQDIQKLYKKWPEIKRFIKSIGCNAVEAEDIFQESLVIFIRKKEDPNFVLTVEPFYYVKNTCKLLWYNQARKNQKEHTIEITSEITSIDDEWFEKEMKIAKIENAIENIGKQCKEILQLFYGRGMNMIEIAKKVGLRNDKVVKAQKYRCLQKAKDLVHNNPVEF